jgi:RNA polymerase sigma-70 factor (ECF subfamily)
MVVGAMAFPLSQYVRPAAIGADRTALLRPKNHERRRILSNSIVYFEVPLRWMWRIRPAQNTMDELEGLFPRAQALDPQALSVLHDRFYPLGYRYIAYRLGDGALSEDLTSEVFLRLLEALHAKRVNTVNLRAWLYATANHLVMDVLRQRYRRPLQSLSEEQPAGTDNPERAIEHEQRLEAVQRTMQHLTPEQQHVLSLRFSQDLSLEDVAAIMGKSVNAVKVLQFRALAALRRWLQREGL